jgi:hypothetical protein
VWGVRFRGEAPREARLASLPDLSREILSLGLEILGMFQELLIASRHCTPAHLVRFASGSGSQLLRRGGGVPVRSDLQRRSTSRKVFLVMWKPCGKQCGVEHLMLYTQHSRL